jgi:hypothetical protein
MLIIAIAFYLFASAAAGIASRQRGLGFGAGFVMSIFLTPLLGFLYVIALPDLTTETAAQKRHDELISFLKEKK